MYSELVASSSEAHLLAGRTDEAADLAGRALDLFRAHRQRGFEAWTLRLLGEIASATSSLDMESAETNYRQALALATDLGMRPLIARCYLGLGALCRRTGQREQAAESLTIATTMFREMDMEFWLERAEAELAAGPHRLS
jgi:tetratricopeptide (TPR) repeat protein